MVSSISLSLRLGCSSASGGCQDTLIVQPAANIGDVVLPNSQGIRAGMHGVVPGHQVVRVLDRRAEDEAGIAERFKLDRLIALLEHGDFAHRYLLRRCHDPLVRCNPSDVVPLGRVKDPALSGLEAHIEESDATRRLNNAFHTVVFACDNPRGTGKMEVGSAKILALRFGKFKLGRHSDPKLKALDPLLAEHSAGMPNTATGAHPLNTAGLDDAFAAGGLLVERLPGQNDGERRNSRMGMKAEFGCRRRIGVEVVKKHERLDTFTNVARTDQSG